MRSAVVGRTQKRAAVLGKKNCVQLRVKRLGLLLIAEPRCDRCDDRVGLFDLALKSQFLAARTFTAAMANAAETLAHPLQQEEGRQSEEDKKAA